ncbi:diguanylate cyclase [Alteromonas genovensis]|uniref:diguanylate cyclase n=1 Tax=Alteromonas genovensis TaxID=471225 RepID=A0A6N9THS1_9ALTE|nr:ligand-binding sensor domain-containing diguanylate cyclase [Alteromonas genovensis]NDW14248.1 diguanylate cyclase [Alteromonas genovensis]
MFSRLNGLLRSIHLHSITFLLLIVMLLCTKSINALASEDYRSERWQVSNAQALEKGQLIATDGLPQISVHAIAQDTDGFFWLGTENGLARFDGRKFEILNTINEPSLPSNWIEYLFVDNAGKVWIATASGVVSYSKGAFKAVEFKQSQDRITYIDQSADGQLWFFGTSLWSLENNQLVASSALEQSEHSEQNEQHLKQQSPEQQSPIQQYPEQQKHQEQLLQQQAKLSAASIDGNSIWLLNADKTLVYFDAVTNATCEYPLTREREYAQLQAANQRVYILEDKRLRSFMHSADNCSLTETPQVTSYEIHKLTLSNSGYPLLLTMDGKAYNVSPVKGTLEESWDHVVTPSLVKDVLTLFQGDELTLLGTKANGLVLLWPSAITRQAAGQSFAKARAWSFFVDDSVYAASSMGVYKRIDDEQWQLVIPPSALNGNDAYSLQIDNGTMWVGTRNGLYRVNTETSAVMPVSGFEGYQINTLYKDGNSLWLGTNNGLFKQQDDSFIEVIYFASQSVRSIHRSKTGSLWVGTESGLYSANLDSGNNTSQWQQVNMAGVSSAFVSNITESPNGHLFFATYGDGLFQKNKKGNWTQYTIKNGLPFQNLFNINIAANQLWVSGASGIFSVDLSGLYKQQIQRHIVLRDDGTFTSRKDIRCCNGAGNNRGVVFNNKLYYPTLAGVLSVDTIKRQPMLSPVVISGVYQNGERFTFASSTIEITNERNLEVAYTMPIFAGEEVPQYRYRLTKGDSSWVYAGQRELAYFTNLPSGEFVFEVSAKLGSDEWLPPTTLSINVAPYWWETWWARGVAVIVILFVGWLLFSVRTRALMKRNDMLEKMVEERTLAYERVNKELEQKNDALRQVANTDPLTGLSNRRAIKEYLPKLFDTINARQIGYKNAEGKHAGKEASEDICALFLIDLDNFKRINDEFGHDKGDSVLTYVADAIESVSRPEDCLLRWGGEEFLLIVPTIKKQSFKALNDRLHAALTNLHYKLGLPSPITMSIGAVWLPWENSQTDFHQWEHSMLLTDLALYRVKETGRNGTAFVHTTKGLSDWLNWSKEGIEKAEKQAVITIERI